MIRNARPYSWSPRQTSFASKKAAKRGKRETLAGACLYFLASTQSKESHGWKEITWRNGHSYFCFSKISPHLNHLILSGLIFLLATSNKHLSHLTHYFFQTTLPNQTETWISSLHAHLRRFPVHTKKTNISPIQNKQTQHWCFNCPLPLLLTILPNTKVLVLILIIKIKLESRTDEGCRPNLSGSLCLLRLVIYLTNCGRGPAPARWQPHAAPGSRAWRCSD